MHECKYCATDIDLDWNPDELCQPCRELILNARRAAEVVSAEATSRGWLVFDTFEVEPEDGDDSWGLFVRIERYVLHRESKRSEQTLQHRELLIRLNAVESEFRPGFAPLLICSDGSIEQHSWLSFVKALGKHPRERG